MVHKIFTGRKTQNLMVIFQCEKRNESCSKLLPFYTTPKWSQNCTIFCSDFWPSLCFGGHNHGKMPPRQKCSTRHLEFEFFYRVKKLFLRPRNRPNRSRSEFLCAVFEGDSKYTSQPFLSWYHFIEVVFWICSQAIKN